MNEQHKPIQTPTLIHQNRGIPHPDTAQTLKRILRDCDVQKNVWSKVQAQTLANGEHQELDARGLQRIQCFVKDAVLRGRPAFTVSKDRAGDLRVQPELAIPSPEAATAYFRHQFEPSEFLRVFLEAGDELGLVQEWPLRGPLEPCRAHPGFLVYQWANQFAELVRTKGKSKDSRERAAQRRFAAEENFRRGEELINALFASYSRLNVIRIDLLYKREHRASLEEAKADFNRLLNNSRQNSIFKHIVACIWRLEWAFDAGYHWHVIVFQDDSKSNRDWFVAQRIGDYWCNVITEERGRMHNCNADKNSYKRLGIGTIHHEDFGKRDVLVNVVLRYLTKADELARPRVPKGTRTFGMSQMPKPHSGLGRPRRTLSLAEVSEESD
jgi:hypothetical protein